MSNSTQTVFISYSRSRNRYLARAVFLALSAHGYDVFMDVATSESSGFTDAIAAQIHTRHNIVVILAPGTVERLTSPDDLMRMEIETAMSYNRNIIMLMVNGFDFRDVHHLLAPEKRLKYLETDKGYPRIILLPDYFEAAMGKLRAAIDDPTVQTAAAVPSRSETADAQRQQQQVLALGAPTPQQLHAEALLADAYTRARMGDLDGAIHAYNAAIEHVSDFAAAYYGRAQVFQAMGDPRASADFDTAIQLDRSFDEAYMQRARMRAQDGDYDGAEKDFSTVISNNPRRADAYHNRAALRHQYGDVDNAIDDYTRAIEYNPDESVVYRDRGSAFRQRGMLDEAIQDFTQAITLDDGDDMSYTLRGRAKLEKGDVTGAQDDFEMALSLNDGNTQAYFSRAYLRYHYSDRPEVALDDFESAFKHDNSNADALYNRGIIHSQTGSLNDAIEDYTRAIEINHDANRHDADAYFNRGLARKQSRDYVNAIDDYTLAIKHNSDDAAAFFNRGNAHADVSSLEDALADYDRAISIDPDYAQAYYNRGNVHRRLDNLQKALQDYDRANALMPDTPMILNNRANIRNQLGDIDGARADYERALRIDPNDSITRNNLNRFLRQHIGEDASFTDALDDFLPPPPPGWAE